MKPLNQSIIDALTASARAHWAAINTYLAQGAHFERWGYGKLAAAARADAEEELKHLGRLQLRLEDFDAQAAYDLGGAWPRHDLPGILAANLEIETRAAQIERAGILAARQWGDEVTAGIFAENLDGSEQSIREIEATQRVIGQVTLANYLANQV